MRLRALLALGVLGLLGVTGAAGCGRGIAPASGAGSTPSSSTGSPSTPGGAGAGELTGVGTVLDRGQGPQLCLGGVRESYPPQCEGPPIVGWDWATAPDTRTAAGVTWGDYAVTGTWDGSVFTMTRPPVGVQDYRGPLPPPVAGAAGLATPCPAPVGGWRPAEPARATQATLEAALATAARLPGYGTAWVDQSVNPADPSTQPELMNDPTRLVLNVRVTGDLAAAEAALRAVWGGALCVSAGRYTEAQLRTVVDVLAQQATQLGLLEAAGPSGLADHVSIRVIHDDGTLQAELDRRYGAGVVRVLSALVPVG